jgi:hypothetical protein
VEEEEFQKKKKGRMKKKIIFGVCLYTDISYFVGLML